ncbi:MAG: aminotransferase class V-fold PLP-dependent enzyme [Ignavibacteria bacterium]|nr:aminotransferase class V-fold PLP-dependent enzyme [Ignavibacteria bacterium]
MRSDDPLLVWRKEFPILEKTTYLISNSLGAMPRGVYDRMHEYAETWATRGVRAWADSWWDMSVTVGDTIAPLLGAKPGAVTMHPNISLLQAILISCFDFTGRRNRIVYSDMEFPSVMYVYEKFARSRGATLNVVHSEDGISLPTGKILDAIDERTRIVPISHVLFKSAYIQDVRAIVRKAHECGAVVILDAYHSVGIIPVDVQKLGVDILVGGVLKWLCGGPGGAFLWIRPSLRKQLKPTITGWCAHERPFAFETEMQYSTDVTKFLNGTPAIPALYAALEGPGIIAQVGVRNIRAKSIHQTSLIIEEAQRHGFTVNSPLVSGRRGGTVSVMLPHAYEVSRELLARDILVDFREGAGIRLAPHFYTTDDEVVSTIGEMRNILESGAYRKHSRKHSRVT